jgi:MoaA/NifB/PqqE/SkfB family radical SAM enzyme
LTKDIRKTDLKKMIYPLSKIENDVYSMLPPLVHPFLKDLFGNNNYLKRKLINFLLNKFEMRLKRKHLFSYPYYILIDPTNICTLRCPLCPTWQDSKERPKGKMEIQKYYKLLDEVGPYLFALALHNWGEPLLHPELPEMIRYAKRYNIIVGLSTNLNHLSDETAKKIAGSEIDIVVVSIDGVSQESYSRYRRGGNFEKVISNIEKLDSCRNPGTKFPLLVWQFLVNRYNESEIDSAHRMAEKMGMQFIASPMRTDMRKELLLPLHERVREMKDWLPENPAYRKYAHEIKNGTKTRQATCKWLWNSTVINWDGSVSPCCGVFETKWDFQVCYDSRAKKEITLHKAWNSPRYKMARKLVAAYLSGSKNLSSLVELAKEEPIICVNCIHFGFLED